jgi:hypothetical protein
MTDQRVTSKFPTALRFTFWSVSRPLGGEITVHGMASTRRRQTFPPVTMGHIRSHGCRELLVYCESPWCNHSATLNADWLPDDTELLDLDPRMVCTACGLIGADVRPDWTPIRGDQQAHVCSQMYASDENRGDVRLELVRPRQRQRSAPAHTTSPDFSQDRAMMAQRFTSSMPAMMCSLSSCLEATRIWRRTERVNLEQKPTFHRNV